MTAMVAEADDDALMRRLDQLLAAAQRSIMAIGA